MQLVRKNLSGKVSAANEDSKERCTLAVGGMCSGARTSHVCSTRRVGTRRSHGRRNERRVGVGCGGSEAEMGLREALQVFVRRMPVGARHASRTKAGGRDSRVGGATRQAGEKRRDRRPTGSGSRRNPLPKGWQGGGTSDCVHGRASVFSQTRRGVPAFIGVHLSAVRPGPGAQG
jgi:hypothetical protein